VLLWPGYPIEFHSVACATHVVILSFDRGSIKPNLPFSPSVFHGRGGGGGGGGGDGVAVISSGACPHALEYAHIVPDILADSGAGVAVGVSNCEYHMAIGSVIASATTDCTSRVHSFFSSPKYDFSFDF